LCFIDGAPDMGARRICGVAGIMYIF
jgi:hypothetical protein